MFSDFGLKNCAELEAHIALNAAAARANFEKHYAMRLADPNRDLKYVKPRLSYVEGNKTVVMIDLGDRKFDYSTLEARYLEEVEKLTARTSPKSVSLDVGVKKGGNKGEKGLAQGDDCVWEDDEGPVLPLVLSKCDYTNIDKVVKSLCSARAVTSVSFETCGLSADEADDLATLVAFNGPITALNLSSNNLGAEGVAKLIEPFQQNTHIEELDLGNNGLLKSAAVHLATILAAPTCPIKRLALAGNKLGIYGTEELSKGLLLNRSVIALLLQNNDIGNDGLEKLWEIVFNHPASPDLLSSKKQSGKGQSSEAMPAREAIYRNSTLVYIAWDHNKIDEGAKETEKRIETVLKENERAYAVTNWIEVEVRTRARLERGHEMELYMLFRQETAERVHLVIESEQKVERHAIENEEVAERSKVIESADVAANKTVKEDVEVTEVPERMSKGKQKQGGVTAATEGGGIKEHSATTKTVVKSAARNPKAAPPLALKKKTPAPAKGTKAVTTKAAPSGKKK